MPTKCFVNPNTGLASPSNILVMVNLDVFFRLSHECKMACGTRDYEYADK